MSLDSPKQLYARTEKGVTEQLPPEGWKTASSLAKENGLTHSRIQSIAESFRDEFPDRYLEVEKGSTKYTYYSPELILKIKENISEEKLPPEGWLTATQIAQNLKISPKTIRKQVPEGKSDWVGEVKKFRAPHGRVEKFYSPRLIQELERTLNIEPAPGDWQTISEIANDLNVGRSTVHNIAEPIRKSSPQLFRNFKNERGRVSEYYSPDLIAQIKEIFFEYEFAPKNWMTNLAFAEHYSMNKEKIKEIAELFRGKNPDWFKDYKGANGRIFEHYSPELIVEILKYVDAEETAEEGWATNKALSNVLNVSPLRLKKIADTYRSSHPQWFKVLKNNLGHKYEHYAPELVQIIKIQIESKNKEKRLNDALEKKRIDAENQCDEFLDGVIEGARGNPEEFKKLISIFGLELGFDILYRFHPEFRGLEVEYVRSSIAKYLGDFLTIRSGVVYEELELTLPFLSEAEYKDSLFESLKSDCLSSLHERKRSNPVADDLGLIQTYIADIREQTESFANDDLNEVIERVHSFYTELYAGLVKPEGIIDTLRAKRPFPDINQRLNIKEVADKKRMLIGDEMGMGKSASAILSKEYLGVERALVIVPSNVVATWQRYISDAVSSEGDPIGYFKQGQAPRVFVVESEQALADVNPDDFDYVVISQERLSEKYVARLKDLSCGMVIVDEVHKLKNITEGERSQAALDLLSSLDAESTYSVLLSGTPVPNKVGDVAVILKLLYPERFSDWDNKALTSAIINGDILDLRSLLVPRMQMKTLQESVEMPSKQEEVLSTELNESEKEVYELLLEDDDLTASQKIQVLRKFVMNPSSLETTPLLESSKIADVRDHIHSAFREHNKVVLVVNSYIDGIIIGEENLLEKLQLPKDVGIRIIYGGTSKEERGQIENEIRESNDKLLLVLSGQTADVGVDFSAADHLVFYNDPWTLYDKQQQAARVYRPGLAHDLEIVTSVTEGTIEEGINDYIEVKFKAIEKILRGVPLTEIEKGLLRTAEKQSTFDVEGDLEIAKEWLNSPQNRLHKFFGATKEIGEKKFQEFLQKYGDEYAEYYQEMGSRGFQANTSRVAGALINKFIEERGQKYKEIDILDSASGPFMLERHIADPLQDRVYSLDINRSHFDRTAQSRKEGLDRSVVGSFVQFDFPDKEFEYVNMSLAFHYSKLDIRRKDYERVKALQEMNRVLKIGGRAVINLVYSLDLKNPEQFRETVRQIGFGVIEKYTGVVTSGDNFASPCIVLEKVEHIDTSTQDVAEALGKSGLNGLKLKKSDLPSLRHSRRVIPDFEINGEEIKVPFNLSDILLALEQEEIFAEARELVRFYGSIGEIPKDEIINRNYLRIRVVRGSSSKSDKYRLFKRGEQAGGFVEFVK